MKLENLPIWPRILAAKPRSCKATRPINILRAVLENGGLRQAGPTREATKPVSNNYPIQKGWEHYHWLSRSERRTQADRDERRAKHDKRFARQLAKRQAEAARVREIAMHIADRWHNSVSPLYRSQYASILWKDGLTDNKEWDRYSKNCKWPCIYQDAGVFADASEIRIWPVGRAPVVHLPLPPKALIRSAALSEPHPVGLFAVPVKGQAGVFACMGVKKSKVTRRQFFLSGRDENRTFPSPRSAQAWMTQQNRALVNKGYTLSPWDTMPRPVKSRKVTVLEAQWVAVGFCVRGRLVPECVARGEITISAIRAEQNTEARQIMIERFGAERYIREVGAIVVDHSDLGTLYDLSGMKIVKVINATPEPTGEYKDYFLRVPPTMTSAAEAVAWTFGMKAEEYQPVAQS